MNRRNFFQSIMATSIVATLPVAAMAKDQVVHFHKQVKITDYGVSIKSDSQPFWEGDRKHYYLTKIDTDLGSYEWDTSYHTAPYIRSREFRDAQHSAKMVIAYAIAVGQYAKSRATEWNSDGKAYHIELKDHGDDFLEFRVVYRTKGRRNVKWHSEVITVLDHFKKLHRVKSFNTLNTFEKAATHYAAIGAGIKHNT